MKVFLVTYYVKGWEESCHCLMVAKEEGCVPLILEKWDDSLEEIEEIKEIKTDVQNVICLDLYTAE